MKRGVSPRLVSPHDRSPKPSFGQSVEESFFLAAVSDKHGVSFYSDVTTAALLRFDLRAVQQARNELVAHDLVAYRHPLAQVLSLPQPRPRASGAAPMRFGDIMRQLSASPLPGGRS